MLRFIKLYVRLWRKNQISLRASALTYTLILGIVPALAICLSLSSAIFDIRKLSVDFKLFLLRHLTDDTTKVAATYLDTFLKNTRFSTIGLAGFIALLVTSLLLLSSIEESINTIWGIKKKKALWKRFLLYNLMLLLGPVVVSLSLSVTTVVGKLFPQFLVKANLSTVLLSAFFLTFIYKVFPNKKVQWRAALVAGSVGAVACEVAKWGYAIYTAKAMIYNKLYGGLAALPLFLLWIYVNWLIFLSGALLSYVLQHHRSSPAKKQETAK